MPIPHDRRAVLKKLAAATLAPAFSGLALADTYPSRPINLVVPFAAGGMTDILGRQLGHPGDCGQPPGRRRHYWCGSRGQSPGRWL